MAGEPAKSVVTPVMTKEIGYANAGDGAYWSSVEQTPELRWPLACRVFDQMARQDSQITAVLRAVTLPIRRTAWSIDPNGARPEVVAMIAQDLGLPIKGQSAPPPRARGRSRFSWSDHLRMALLMAKFGHMFFEQVYEVDADGFFRLRKLLPLMPQTLSDVKVAGDGGLIGVEQYGSGFSGTTKTVPVWKLVAYALDREAGDWLGNSLLRPAYKNWLLKDRLLRIQTQTIERNGMGVPVYEAGERDEQGQLDEGKKIAQSYKAGDASGAATPFGAKLRLAGVEGNLPDAQPAINYHDNAIAKAVLAHFLNLDGKGGSYALASTQEDFFTLSLQTLAEQVCDVANQHIIEDLVDANFGTDEPAPLLVFEEIGSRQDATAAALKTLVDAGLIQPSASIEAAILQRLSLPSADPAATDEKPTRTPEELALLVNAANALIRSGFDPQASLALVGLNPVEHLGLLPVTVQRPTEADGSADETLADQLTEEVPS